MCKLGLILEKMIKDNWTLRTQPTQIHEGISKKLHNLQLGPRMMISTAFTIRCHSITIFWVLHWVLPSYPPARLLKGCLVLCMVSAVQSTIFLSQIRRNIVLALTFASNQANCIRNAWFAKKSLWWHHGKNKAFWCSFNSNMGQIHSTKHAEVHKIVNQDRKITIPEITGWLDSHMKHASNSKGKTTHAVDICKVCTSVAHHWAETVMCFSM